MQNAQAPQTIPTVQAPEAILDALGTARPQVGSRARSQRNVGGTIGTVLLTLLGISWALPLLWSITVALRPAGVSVATGSPWWGGALTLHNFADAWDRVPF